jgi:N4-gp56 family major capsid protein
MSLGVSGAPSALISGAYPQYSTASTTKFIPEVWSGKLQAKFYKSTVLAEITNNDWEGEIKGQGDKVYIRSIPTITIRSYTKGMNLTNEVPTSTPLELNIDQGQYFSVVLDDVDAVQADVKLMDMFTNDASEQMKITIDADVLNGVKAGAATANKGASAGAISGNINLGATYATRAISKTNVLDLILDMGQVLDEQNVPETGRWLVIPSWMAAMIKNSDLKQAYLTGDSQSPLRNGKLGMIDRFTLYVSNNLPTATDLGSDSATGGTGTAVDVAGWNILAGTRDAISFASQMANVETIRAQSTFGNIVRGLNVYGYKVTKPEALVNALVSKA